MFTLFLCPEGKLPIISGGIYVVALNAKYPFRYIKSSLPFVVDSGNPISGDSVELDSDDPKDLLERILYGD